MVPQTGAWPRSAAQEPCSRRSAVIWRYPTFSGTAAASTVHRSRQRWYRWNDISSTATATRLTKQAYAYATSRKRHAKSRFTAPIAGTLRAGPAEQGLDPGGQLARAERLDQVVVGAGREAALDVGLLRPRGQHDDHHVGGAGIRAQHPAHVQPGHARHGHVEHGDVRDPVVRGRQRGRPVLRRDHVEPGLFQLERDPVADVRVIVGNQYGSHVFLRPRSPATSSTTRATAARPNGLVSTASAATASSSGRSS